MQAQIRITEQPAPKVRYRYESEVRSSSTLLGVSSTPQNKTFPTIQIVGLRGRAVLIVSCVTKHHPYRPHPHNIVGAEDCRNGVCIRKLNISTETMTVQFVNLGIQRVTKKDVQRFLQVRQEMNVDPFKAGFDHRNNPETIDLNVVRLCFQVWFEGSTPGKFSKALNPVESDPIHDTKALLPDLRIFKLSHCTSYVDGGKNDIILLCEKVAEKDIQIRFYEENGDWEALVDLQVHKQYAIWFKSPKYKTIYVTDPVNVFIQLRRPSDGATSEALRFQLLPVNPGVSGSKRQRTISPDQILKHLQGHDNTSSTLSPEFVPMSQMNVTRSKPYNVDLSTLASTSQQQVWTTQMPLVPQPYAPITDSNTQPHRNISPDINVAPASQSTVNNNDVLDDADAEQVNSEEINKMLLPANSKLPELTDDNLFSG